MDSDGLPRHRLRLTDLHLWGARQECYHDAEETAGEEVTEAADGAADGATAASHTMDEPGAHDSARSISAYLLASNVVHQPTDAPPVSRPVDWH